MNTNSQTPTTDKPHLIAVAPADGQWFVEWLDPEYRAGERFPGRVRERRPVLMWATVSGPNGIEVRPMMPGRAGVILELVADDPNASIVFLP